MVFTGAPENFYFLLQPHILGLEFWSTQHNLFVLP